MALAEDTPSNEGATILPGLTRLCSEASEASSTLLDKARAFLGRPK